MIGVMPRTQPRNARELADLAQRQPWAQAALAALAERLEPMRRHGVAVPPPEPATAWRHLHLCSRCQTRLAFALASPHEHRCPGCGLVNRGPVHDACWLADLADQQSCWAEEACTLALAGIPGWRDYARNALLAFADGYAGWHEHGDRVGTGRLMPQGLEEAVVALRLQRVWSDLLALGALDGGEDARVRRQLFAPVARLLARQTWEVHNIHLWMACATWACAEAAGETALRQGAERQILRNLDQGIAANGMWFELSPHYHFYALDGLLGYVRAARTARGGSLADPHLASLLQAPLALAMPDGHFALLNDGWPDHPVANQAPLYELGEGLEGGCAGVLAWLYRNQGARRDSAEALRWGPEALPEEAWRPEPLSVTDGLAVARRSRVTVLLKAARHAGSHDHGDQCGLSLWLPGSDLHAADRGTPGYSSPLFRSWFKPTLGHNAVLVDGADQELSEGWISRTVAGSSCDVLTGETNRAYGARQVWLRRVVTVGEGWVLDWVWGESEAERDWLSLFHATGSLDAPGPALTWLPSPHLTAQRRLAEGPWAGAFRARSGDERLLVRALPPAGGAVLAGRGPDLPADRQRDCLALSGHGRSFHARLLLQRGAEGQVELLEADDQRQVLAVAGQRFAIDRQGVLTPLA